MTDLAITVTVDRTSLSLGALALNDSSYRVVALGPGVRQYRPIEADSDFVHGELIIASLMKGAKRHLVVRCTGTSQANLWALMAAVEAAFGQDSYSVSGTLGGQPFSWTGCTPADMEPGSGGSYEKLKMFVFWQDIVLAIPSDPVDPSGPW